MKAMKKVFAMLLALAMIVTAVPVSSASAATYNMKAGSAGIITKTLYAGRSHTLKLNGYKASQIKSTTWSVGKTTVVKLASKTKTTAKMTCVGKGYTVVTAKMTLTNKKVKTFKAKITVKNPSVSVAAAEVEVGKTVALAVTPAPTNATLAYTSDNTDVATVTDKGVVTGVKAGTANVTVTLTCGTKKATATAVVTVKEAAEKAELKIVELTATKVNELTAVFAAPVTDEVEIKLTRGTTTDTIEATPKWSDDKTTLTYTTKADLQPGEYTLTVTSKADATITTSATCNVSQETYKIIIDAKTALLDMNDKKIAYVTYDVQNQYNESVRESVSVTWTPSNGKLVKDDKALGRLTIQKDDEFVYGSMLVIVGVYKTEAKQFELKIGLAQGVDEVVNVGFIRKTNKTEILKTLPNNFQKKEFVMVFQVKDQNGCIMNPSDYPGMSIKKHLNITAISRNNAMLIKNEFEDAGSYTVKGTEYFAVTVEPAMYADRGGEVDFLFVSTDTGKQTPKNIVVGEAPRLQKLVLHQPSGIVSDGQTNVTLSYTATATDGNTVTNYETIVRSTNTLTLNAGDGTTLKISEDAAGKAVITWSDAGKYQGKNGYNESSAWDDNDRSVALTTVVIGGESETLMLQVKDKARPVAVKTANLASDITTVVVEENNGNFDLKNFQFIDQYGRDMAKYESWAHGDAWNFFDMGEMNDKYYAVKIEPAVKSKLVTPCATMLLVSDTSGEYGAAKKTQTWSLSEDAVSAEGEDVENWKYSVAAIDDSSAKANDPDEWSNCSKSLSVDYTLIPMKKVTGIKINGVKKMHVSLGLEAYATGAEAGIKATDLVTALKDNSSSLPKSATIDTKDNAHKTFKVVGEYKKVAVRVDTKYVDFACNKFDINTSGMLTAVSGAAITLGDFFDAKTPNFTRKDGTATVSAIVYRDTAKTFLMAEPTVDFSFSDEGRRPDSITKCAPADLAGTDIAIFTVEVKDQYEDGMDLATLKVKIFVELVEENTNELARLENSFEVSGNSTSKVSITGVEIGDKYKVTVEASNMYGKTEKVFEITAGADKWAYIDQDGDKGDKDFNLREKLHYAY